MIKTVIFCGGYGTRIRDVSEHVPKPLLNIGPKPVLWHIMKTYARYGIQDFVLTLGYKGWLIKEYFLNYHQVVSDIKISLSVTPSIEIFGSFPEENWQIILAETGQDTHTAGRLWLVRKYLQDSELFCVTYGDGVADINITDLIAYHRAHGKIGTITGVHPPGRFGVLETRAEDDMYMVSRFAEKPQALEGLINGGFFVFDHRLWDYMTDDLSMPFEQRPLTRLAEDGQLAVYRHTGFWQPMDTYREWRLLNNMWQAGNHPWFD